MSNPIPLAFVLMPFDDEFSQIYDLFIKKVLEGSGFQVARADDIESNRSIMQDIISFIESADLIIADLTTNNPNVYYELGIAHSFQKKVILLTQDIDDLPFDLRPYRVVEYNTHFSKIKSGEDELDKLARGALNETIIFGNPVSDYSSLKNGFQKSLPLLQETELEIIEEDDRGFIDHLEDFETGTQKYTEITLSMTEVIKKIAVRLGKATGEMQLANSDKSGTATKWKKRISTSLANDIIEEVNLIESFNTDQASILINIENSLEYILKYININSDEDKEATKGLINSFQTLLDAGKYSKDQITAFIGIINDNTGFEKNLNKAYQKLSTSLNNSTRNMDQMLSMYIRGIEVAKQKLSENT